MNLEDIIKNIPVEIKEDFLRVLTRMTESIIYDTRNTEIRNSMIYPQFFDKLLTDEERAQYYNLPKGCRIRENAKIISPENFVCGEHVWIGEGAVLDASGGLEIGDHTTVGVYVLIWSHTSYLANLSMSNYPKSPLIQRKKTTIGKGVFIVGPTVIYPGVSIGDKTVILPLTTITKSFEGNVILGGSPAKVIKKLDEEMIENLIGGVK